MIPYRFFYNSTETGFSDLLGFVRKTNVDLGDRVLIGLEGWRKGDELTLAWEGEIEEGEREGVQDPTFTCENLFRLFNAPWARPMEYAGPSMSVGDVIVFNPGTEQETAYACASQGFEKIDTRGTWAGVTLPQPKRWVRPAAMFKSYLEAKRNDGFDLTEAEEKIVYGGR